ncbi:clathrin heavy chain [Fonticula alba]|uniref:Clathrin heavy chain n=1 Tax=Fonticula alba TaxID=691883 RepID=A0A058Z4D0_FONAL|nr:clathrin heavy chain [Fonticula alba]KCV69120.1 clathrin heavy chain [Fonticula alba]|eukprot:XP_009496691.1 clathrin heavy chain [Fonticula alba]
MTQAPNVPVKLQELLQLQNIVNANSIGFGNLTFESDKYILVREQNGDAVNLAIVDMANPTQPSRRPMRADSTIMNPAGSIIAVRDSDQIQLLNIEKRARLKNSTLAGIVFWKWVDASTIGIVTQDAVYHWSVEGTSAPVKMFDRLPAMASAQIINYRASPDNKWLFVIGITLDNTRINGAIQLYNVDRSISQPIEGHVGTFATFKMDNNPHPTKVFAFATRSASSSMLCILEIDPSEGNAAYQKKQIPLNFSPEIPSDFPMALHASSRYNMLFMLTKYGFLHVFDIETGTQIFLNRISSETVFIATDQPSTGGLVAINKKGQVLSVSIDEQQIVPYIINTLKRNDLAIRVASRCNLSGADSFFSTQFENLFQRGSYLDAARIAASSPKGFLRTPQTIERFKQLPTPPGQPSILLQYFGILLERGQLNRFESMELARPVLLQGKKELLEKWLKEDKLECTEELGDVVRQHDLNLALSVYLRANASNKVIACFMEQGQFAKLLLYAKKVNYQPDYQFLLSTILRSNPEKGAEFAGLLAKDEAGPLLDHEAVVDAFASYHLVQQATSYLLEVLKDNLESQGHLQTRLLEMNLLGGHPQVADAIIGNCMFTHYDRAAVAQLCEKAQLYQRALEHYTDIYDIKRTIVHTTLLQPEWLLNYFGTLSVEQSLDCLREMLKVNMRQNLQTVIQIAIKYSEQLTAKSLIEMFESFKCSEGLYYYLGSIVNFSQEPEVHLKYIQAATKTGQLKEVERVVRESNCYDPEAVKNFLKEAKLSDLRPLIIVCDRFDFVQDLVLYLFKNNIQHINVYVQKVNPSRTPAVVGALLDLDCEEAFVRNIIKTVTGTYSFEQLVEELEKRNRLKLLNAFLEQKVSEGSTDPAVHNALAKIYVDSNTNPEAFLRENKYYDSLVVGKYCEKRDPYMAVLAYDRGHCDYELIDVCNENSLFKQQARYLVRRQDPALWEHVLKPDNTFRRQLIDQVVQTALIESQNPDEVSLAVKCFMAADLPNELIELLEKIVLENSIFSENRNLQNLLIMTSIRADHSRVMEYIQKLTNYDAPDIANIAIQNGLYEEAFVVFKKHDVHAMAVDVLLDYIKSIERACEFAELVDEPEVWSKLGRAQLRADQIKEAIDSYIRANDPTNYTEVISCAQRTGRYEDMIRFLQMARVTLREAHIESELVFAMAKTDRLADLEEFVNSPNIAQVQVVGDRCFEEGLYEAARILFNSVSNYARLAQTLVHLKEFQAAVDAARKASSTRVWKDLLHACVASKEFRLAQICGLNLIVHAEELDSVIRLYENLGHFDELMGLLEAGLTNERAHMGMFTELAILYAKYQPAKVMEHLKQYCARVNIPKVIRACETAHLWAELVFLYIRYDEFDNAVQTMMSHPAQAFSHAQMKDILPKVATIELNYKALAFYIEYQPLAINDLLSVVSSRIDHSRVIALFQKNGLIALVKPYLVTTQALNLKVVNEALNQILIEEEDVEALRKSIDTYTSFDNIHLAQQLEKMELLEFRRLAAHLYKMNKRYQQSVELSKQDSLYRDAILTAAGSRDSAVVETLLHFFIEKGDRECFAAVLFSCYDLLRPDVVLELAWRNGYMDMAMPFMIQTLRECTTKIDQLETAERERAAREKEQQTSEAQISMAAPGHPLMLTGPGGMMMPPALPAPPGMMMAPPHGGVGHPQMGGHPTGFF